jgi:hypothetical protein
MFEQTNQKLHWMRILQGNQLVKQSLFNEEFHNSGGALTCLVSGQKSL